MSITDELRDITKDYAGYKCIMFIEKGELLTIADRIDAEYQNAEDEWKAKGGQSWLHGYEECQLELMEGNETIAASLEEAGWVRGPLDADGVMWHEGDMSDSVWGEIELIVRDFDGHWYVKGHDTSAPWVRADSLRHHHAPTVEDVLREFGEKYCDTVDGCAEESELFAEYAAKLQLKEQE